MLYHSDALNMPAATPAVSTIAFNIFYPLYVVLGHVHVSGTNFLYNAKLTAIAAITAIAVITSSLFTFFPFC